MGIEGEPVNGLELHTEAGAFEKPIVIGDGVALVVEVEVVTADFITKAFLEIEDKLPSEEGEGIVISGRRDRGRGFA